MVVMPYPDVTFVNRNRRYLKKQSYDLCYLFEKPLINRRPTQTDADISVPRLAGLKESSRYRVKNPLR